MARMRYGWAKIRGVDYSLARMSGMLDLSRDENAKHFFCAMSGRTQSARKHTGYKKIDVYKFA